MCRRVGVVIDPEESTCPPKGVLNDIIIEWFYNQHTIRMERKNEQVAAHREYTRDHGLPKPMEEPQSSKLDE
ncbi:hypothetical protein GOBAR_AA18485 [Gossypium barbadense]|uniref:Uncharacterized protein n=1 Tax=Gossypium barbadense TaxID=3634 RepID=A0A2P5XFR2_GOSBA|nr:hypothetical protein GOBAR_AA18485 [Gossypium barbadense]